MQPKLFDTHTHFNFNAYKNDWKEVIERTLAKGVWFVNVSAEKKTSARAVEIVKKYPEGVYAAVGLHPIHTYDDVFEEKVKGEIVKFETKAEEFDKEYYANLIKSNDKVVAVGETGLDYFHIRKFPASLNKKLKVKQAEVFVEQIKLANEYNKPIIIHCRPDKDFDAYREILEILKDYRKILDPPACASPKASARRVKPEDDKRGRSFGSSSGLAQDDKGGIVHCFQGDEKILEQFLNHDYFIGYNGVITFTDQYDKLVKATPIERIVLETDSPWLAPIPYRGQRNESIYVEWVTKKIAELKNISFEEIAEKTTENAIKIFNLSQ